MKKLTLPETLERLKQISIDELGLSESTRALLKWYGIGHVMDCIAVFYRLAQERDAGEPWPLLLILMFEQVKPALIAADYWDLVLDAEAWCILAEERYGIHHRRFVRWHGIEQDLYEI